MVKRRGYPNQSFFERSPEFFKVYIPEHSSQQLCIPPAFVNKLNGNIPNKTILKDLHGRFWSVDLEEAENGLFMKNGWQGFVNDHSLELGDFLVFRYNGNASFTVRIFGKDGCKKAEALASEQTTTRIKIEEESEAEQTSHKCTRNCKKKCSEIGLKVPEKSNGFREVSQLKSRRIASKIIEKPKVFEAAEFIFPKSPCFIASLSASRRYHLTIPKRLVQEHEIVLNQEMVFRNENGELWPVRVSFMNDGRAMFTKGLKDFWKGNDARLGDRCIFEFVLDRGRKSQEIQVQIVRAGAKTLQHSSEFEGRK